MNRGITVCGVGMDSATDYPGLLVEQILKGPGLETYPRKGEGSPQRCMNIWTKNLFGIPLSVNHCLYFLSFHLLLPLAKFGVVVALCTHGKKSYI